MIIPTILLFPVLGLAVIGAGMVPGLWNAPAMEYSFGVPGHAFAQQAPGLSVTDMIFDAPVLGGVIDIDLFESGGRTYAAVAAPNDKGVQIFDMTDPNNIETINQIFLPDGIARIATFESGGRTYAAGTTYNGVQVLDLTDPDDITSAGSIVDVYTPVISYAADIDLFESGGRTYAAITTYNGVQVLDLTDPDEINLAGNIVDDDTLVLNGTVGIDLFESGGRTYAAVAAVWDNGIQLLDLTDPGDMIPAGSIVDDDTLVLGYAASIDVFESGGRTYAVVGSANEFGIQTLDLTDPHHIVATANISYSDHGRSASISTFESGGRTYAVVSSPTIRTGIHILDLTEPNHGITIVDDYPLYTIGYMAIFESDGRTYVTVVDARSEGAMWTFDLTDPGDMVLVGEIITPDDILDDTLVLDGSRGIDTFESGGRTYAAVAAQHDKGVQVLDLTDPNDIIAAGSIVFDDGPAPAGASGIDVFESGHRQYAAVTSHFGIQVLDLTDPNDITATDSLSPWSSSSNMRDYNMTDPDDMASTGGIVFDDTLVLAGASGIGGFESGGRTYAAVAASSARGVQVLDLTDPDEINPAGSIVDDDSLVLYGAFGIDIFESGGRTYAAVTAVRDNGVQVLDLTDPDDITAAGSIVDDDALVLARASGIDVFESGGRTYAAVVAWGDRGIQVLDLTDPDEIKPAGSIVDDDALVPGYAVDIVTFESGGRTYAAVTTHNGILMLDLTDPENIVMTGIFSVMHATNSITVFESDGHAYLAATLRSDGVQILQITTESVGADTSPTVVPGVPAAEETETQALAAIRHWSGSEPGSITDSQMLASLGMDHQGAPIPGWVMTHLGPLVEKDGITIDEFRAALVYVLETTAEE